MYLRIMYLRSLCLAEPSNCECWSRNADIPGSLYLPVSYGNRGQTTVTLLPQPRWGLYTHPCTDRAYIDLQGWSPPKLQARGSALCGHLCPHSSQVILHISFPFLQRLFPLRAPLLFRESTTSTSATPTLYCHVLPVSRPPAPWKLWLCFSHIYHLSTWCNSYLAQSPSRDSMNV